MEQVYSSRPLTASTVRVSVGAVGAGLICCSGFASTDLPTVSFMEHLGQTPGFEDRTSGCIVQTYVVVSCAAAVPGPGIAGEIKANKTRTPRIRKLT
jgi:hypothetical protein